jgi:TolB-like protein
MVDDCLRFGRFRFDAARRELSRDGVPVRVGRRALEILSVLVSARGAVVAKDELMQRVWGGQVVEENNLQVQISALRKVLDDGNGSHVMTVPGRGYRLIGVVGAEPILSASHRPSIAVLPFQNLSDDQAQEYFADGITEEIITALSRLGWLFVIARNSSFACRGRNADATHVARELGVRYLLEGSVRKAASRVRIASQLIEGATGAHLWADRFEGGLEDIFDLQDRVTERVLAAVAPRLERAEIERARRKPTESLDAYDYFLRAAASAHRMTREGMDEALRLLAGANALDPDFAAPYGLAAFCYSIRKMSGWAADHAKERVEAARHARRAAELGKDDAVALASGGFGLGFVAGEVEDAVALCDRALELNPNLAFAWFASAVMRIRRGGEPDVAAAHAARAMRLSPLDPNMPLMQGTLSYAHFFAGRYEEAAAWAERAVAATPQVEGILRIAAASKAMAGRRKEAHALMVRALQLDPHMSVSKLRIQLTLFQRPQDRALYVDALRKAGLPE